MLIKVNLRANNKYENKQDTSMHTSMSPFSNFLMHNTKFCTEFGSTDQSYFDFMT